MRARPLRLGAAYATGIPALRRSDVLLASFPRSGSTLFRFMVAHYALGEDAASVSFAELNRLLPELGASWLWDADALPGVPRVVKTHRPYFWGLARPRAVHLVRSPLDALASYHRYWMAREGSEHVERGAFLRDRRRGLPWWIRHTASWAPRADVEVRYAALRADPAGVVAKALETLGVPVSAKAMQRAADRSRPEAVRAREREGGVAGPDRLREGSVFARDRSPGDGGAYFSEADRAWARDRLAAAGLDSWGRA